MDDNVPVLKMSKIRGEYGDLYKLLSSLDDAEEDFQRPIEFALDGFDSEEIAEISKILVEYAAKKGLDHCMDTTNWPSVCVKLQRPN